MERRGWGSWTALGNQTQAEIETQETTVPAQLGPGTRCAVAFLCFGVESGCSTANQPQLPVRVGTKES
eukprot:351801-Rhodomonas_salina.2